ncbi:MAG: DUF2513 domain-containing protein, partial [Chloroflexi bacterium]|nr:DUF2513 domain-containing protein [Chloroflexota bacterium]
MQRDMELARKILLEIEKQPYTMGWVDLDISGYSAHAVSYHVQIMAEASLVEADDVSTFGGSDWRAKRLTWAGHEFLDASRDEGRWKEALTVVKKAGGGLTFDVLKE